MICPSCGAEVPQSKFCVNCGQPLPAIEQTENAFTEGQAVETTVAIPTGAAAELTEPVSQETVPLADPTVQMPQAATAPIADVGVEQPTEPVSQGYIPEVPGDEAWQAQPPVAYQMGQTDQMPPQEGAFEVPGDEAWQAQPPVAYQMGQTDQMPPQEGAFETPAFGASDAPAYGAPEPPVAGAAEPPAPGAPEPPKAKKGARFDMPPTGPEAPNAAFVLVIVGLVLSALTVTFVPGLVCSIIGLALNASYNKKGLTNHRKTSTLVIGIIGVVIGAIAAIAIAAVTMLAVYAVNEADRLGIEAPVSSVATTSSSASASSTAGGSSNAASSSASSASSASTDAPSASAASSPASSSAAPSRQSSADYSGDIFHDVEFNPTLYAVLELSGTEMQDLLAQYGFQWDDDLMSWVASDGSLFEVENADGMLSESAIDALPKGAADQSVAIMLTVEGYDKPADALSSLTRDVVVEDQYGDDEVIYSVVYGPQMLRYLTVVVKTSENGEQTFILFNDASIASGLFAELIGANAGSTMDEVWQTITGGAHIGGVIGG